MKTKSTDVEAMATNGLDVRDRQLLRLLQQDGRTTNAELAQAVGMSDSACLRRVKLLESRGLIERFAAVIDQRAAGFPLSVFVTVTLAAQSGDSLQAFERAIADIPEVMECYLMTGSADYLLRLVARDIDDLERIHATRLTRLAGVVRVNSSIALRAVVKRGVLPL
ncbi:Lrp/AsnC family transcriptional regulator [Caulobacter sp. S45]|uniref:Lrp/AsnC family transcriptional regulator n=1 Tax=Caulobacter sp. S45 TaxID=1641861 RepID=UPI00157547EC|nr:Lrp/AsnC family transcriptional regulator [Caulobacter sp. S45]